MQYGSRELEKHCLQKLPELFPSNRMKQRKKKKKKSHLSFTQKYIEDLILLGVGGYISTLKN